ncbi:MAG: leucine-rich repeat domain-containing protein [Bacteroidetes bacterium]|nr:leucine-rich repeat domain-containing protein [Bacteroidota bacterium]
MDDINKALEKPEFTISLSLELTATNIGKFVFNVQRFENLEALSLIGRVSKNDINDLLEAASTLPKLNSLTLKNNGLTRIPSSISDLRNIDRIQIEGNHDLNYSVFFKKLLKQNSLGIIHLDDNALRKLPPVFKKHEQLNRLFITNNYDLDLEQAIKVLQPLTNLEELALPINQITDLPANIGNLDQLLIIDLRSNSIATLPEEMKNMDKLVSLSIEGNLIDDPAAELEKIKHLDIKFLSLDEGLSPEEITSIQTLFPNARIEEVKQDPLANPSSEDADLPGDEIINDENELIVSTETAQAPSADIDIPSANANTGLTRSFKVKKAVFRAHSTAYTYYPAFFNTPILTYDFDSTRFEERFRDATFANVFRVQQVGLYDYIQFSKPKLKKGELRFKIASDYQRYIAENNPEMTAFQRMYWVYNGDLSKKQFRSRYVRQRQYVDLRLYYHESNNNFTLEVKTRDGFDSLPVYPRREKETLLASQKTYLKRFERYQKGLDRREKSYHKKVVRDKKVYDRLYNSRLNAAWNNLRSFMSKRELEMSREEWLEYYDNIIADERFAFDNAPLSILNISRSLQLAGYQKSFTFLQFQSGTISLKVGFQDTSLKVLPSKKLLVVNISQKTYTVYNGTLSSLPVDIIISRDDDVVILCEIRNGDFAVVDAKTISSTDLSAAEQYFISELFKRRVTSVGQVREYLKM